MICNKKEETKLSKNFQIEMCEIYNKFYPYLAMMAYIWYENARDLFELDKGLLADSLKGKALIQLKFKI